KNVSSRMEHAFADCYGPANLETFWQIMHFARRGRVVDREACNRYATDEHLRVAFAAGPALFVHGKKSRMFDPRGSEHMVKHLNLMFGFDKTSRRARYFYLPLS